MALIPLGILSAAGAGGAVARVSVAGYFGGGQTPTYLTTVDKFAFPGDTRSTLGTGLATARAGLVGFADSGVAGYFTAGYNGSGYQQSGDKFAFPSDTRSTLGNISVNRGGPAAMANSGVAGYVAGGDNYPSGNNTSIDKFAFPSDTRTTLSATLTNATYVLGGMANTSVAGYIAGGLGSGGPWQTVDKITFPGDTKSTLGTGLTTNTFGLTGFHNAGVAGYFAGGEGGFGSSNLLTTVDKFAFPADTKSTLGTGLATAKRYTGGNSNSAVAGYIGGGETSASAQGITTVEKFAFPSDTRSTLGTGLSNSCKLLAGMSNEGVF
jgi:hypothetical protein